MGADMCIARRVSRSDASSYTPSSPASSKDVRIERMMLRRSSCRMPCHPHPGRRTPCRAGSHPMPIPLPRGPYAAIAPSHPPLSTDTSGVADTMASLPRGTTDAEAGHSSPCRAQQRHLDIGLKLVRLIAAAFGLGGRRSRGRLGLAHDCVCYLGAGAGAGAGSQQRICDGGARGIVGGRGRLDDFALLMREGRHEPPVHAVIAEGSHPIGKDVRPLHRQVPVGEQRRKQTQARARLGRLGGSMRSVQHTGTAPCRRHAVSRHEGRASCSNPPTCGAGGWVTRVALVAYHSALRAEMAHRSVHAACVHTSKFARRRAYSGPSASSPMSSKEPAKSISADRSPWTCLQHSPAPRRQRRRERRAIVHDAQSDHGQADVAKERRGDGGARDASGRRGGGECRSAIAIESASDCASLSCRCSLSAPAGRCTVTADMRAGPAGAADRAVRRLLSLSGPVRLAPNPTNERVPSSRPLSAELGTQRGRAPAERAALAASPWFGLCYATTIARATAQRQRACGSDTSSSSAAPSSVAAAGRSRSNSNADAMADAPASASCDRTV